MKILGTPESGAIFSDDMKYRFLLWRRWNLLLPIALFILLNPSSAGSIDNDPTAERQQRRVMAWGNQSDLFSGQLPGRKFGGITIANGCALVSTNPRRLFEVEDPVGEENGFYVYQACKQATSSGGIIVCGWGNHLAELGPSGTTYHDLLIESLESDGFPLSAFKLNNDGTPCHPLYLAYELKPRRWFNGELHEEVV